MMKVPTLILTICFYFNITFANDLALELNTQDFTKAITVEYIVNTGSGSPINNDILFPGERLIVKEHGQSLQLRAIILDEEISLVGMEKSCTINYPKGDEKYLGILVLNLTRIEESQQWLFSCEQKALFPY